MELYSVFITGANRGIGLELVRQMVKFTKPPKFIFATYRSSDGIEALQEIKGSAKGIQVILIKMDVTKTDEIASAKKVTEDMVGDRGLTLLINNAAILKGQRFPQISEEHLVDHFKTNAIGPVMIMQEFFPLLRKAADLRGDDTRMEVTRSAILNISAVVGSNIHMEEFVDVDAWSSPSYNISKTSLNMLSRVIAANLKDQRILVVNMCPGWVKTDMGGESAPLEVEESVSAIIKTLATLNETHHGQFMDRNGKLYEY